MKQGLSLWWNAARYRSFTTAVIPVIVGTLLGAEHGFTWWKALLAVVGSVAILGGTNFVNDYYDHKKGADNESSLGRAASSARGRPAESRPDRRAGLLRRWHHHRAHFVRDNELVAPVARGRERLRPASSIPARRSISPTSPSAN